MLVRNVSLPAKAGELWAENGEELAGELKKQIRRSSCHFPRQGEAFFVQS